MTLKPWLMAMLMIAPGASLFASDALPVPVGSLSASACPTGVDPTYCALASATGGSVARCDPKEDGGKACDKMIRKMIAGSSLHGQPGHDLTKGASAAAKERSLAALTPAERELRLKYEREGEERASRHALGEELIAGGSFAAILAFAAWLVSLGGALALGMGMVLGGSMAILSAGAWLSLGLLPFQGFDHGLMLGLMLSPAICAGGASWALARKAIGRAQSWRAKAMAGLKTALVATLGFAPWVLALLSQIH